MSQVLRAGALGRPRGMGWRGRQEGGLGWGTHVNPWLIHVNVWQEPLQYGKAISLQLIKINEKIKNCVCVCKYRCVCASHYVWSYRMVTEVRCVQGSGTLELLVALVSGTV